jgi:hypothetical protein
MAEIREIVERFRNCDRGGFEEILALLPLLQGQLDPTSFIAGMFFGRRGGGEFDATAAILLATTANAQTQTAGATVASGSLNTLLPFLLLMRPDWERHGEREIEVIEKPGGAARQNR